MALNNNRTWSMIIGVCLIFSTALVLPGFVDAKDSNLTANTLKIAPLRHDISVDPGGQVTVNITVTNPSKNDIEVRPIQNDFIAEDENGNPGIILDDNEYASTHSLKRLLRPMDNFVIPSKESAVAEVVVEVPPDTKPGGYFGAIRFAPAIPDGGGQVNTSISVVSLILLTVNGDAPEELSLTNFDLKNGDGTISDFLINPSNVSLTTRFENGGDIQLAPFGKISVKKGSTVVQEIDFNNRDPKDMILPNSARRWDSSLTGIDSFGKFTVDAIFTYGSSNQTIEASKSFWVIPITAVVVILAMLMTLVGLFIGLFIHLKKKRSLSLR